MRLQGYDAIEYAERHSLPISCYSTPTEEAREDLTVKQARIIASDDNRLIYIDVEFAGWTEGDGSGAEGYRVEDFFDGSRYLGPDEHNIEPEFNVR